MQYKKSFGKAISPVFFKKLLKNLLQKQFNDIILCVTLTFIINKTVTKHLISFKKERFLYICNVQQS